MPASSNVYTKYLDLSPKERDALGEVESFDREIARRFVQFIDSGRADLRDDRVVQQLLALGLRVTNSISMIDLARAYIHKLKLPDRTHAHPRLTTEDDIQHQLTYFPRPFISDRFSSLKGRKQLIAVLRDLVARRADASQLLPEVQESIDFDAEMERRIEARRPNVPARKHTSKAARPS